MDTLEKIISIIHQTTNFKDKIELKNHLKNDLYLDSFDMLMLIHAIEDNYSIQIDEEELKNIETVEDIVQRLESKI